MQHEDDSGKEAEHALERCGVDGSELPLDGVCDTAHQLGVGMPVGDVPAQVGDRVLPRGRMVEIAPEHARHSVAGLRHRSVRSEQAVRRGRPSPTRRPDRSTATTPSPRQISVDSSRSPSGTAATQGSRRLYEGTGVIGLRLGARAPSSGEAVHRLESHVSANQTGTNPSSGSRQQDLPAWVTEDTVDYEGDEKQHPNAAPWTARCPRPRNIRHYRSRGPGSSARLLPLTSVRSGAGRDPGSPTVAASRSRAPSGVAACCPAT